jgi:hypothetical protein
VRVLRSNFEKATAKVKSYTEEELNKMEAAMKNSEYKKIEYTVQDK